MSHRDAVRARLKGGRKGQISYKIQTPGVGSELRVGAGIVRTKSGKSSKLSVDVLRAMLDEPAELDLEPYSVLLGRIEQLCAVREVTSDVARTLLDHDVPPADYLLVPIDRAAAQEDRDWGEIAAACEKIGAVSAAIAKTLLEFDHGISHLTYPGSNAKSGQALTGVEGLYVPFKDNPMLASTRRLRFLGLSGGPSVRVQARIERQSQERSQHRQEQFLLALKYCMDASSGLLGESVSFASTASIKPAENAMPRGNDPAALTELVLKSSHWLLASEVSAQAGLSNKNPSSTPNKWKRNNTIFAISHQGRDRYPSYALGDDGKPLPIMKEILQAFSGKKVPLKIGLWFCSVNSWLGGVAPKDVIETRPEDVLKAAIQEVTPIEHG